MIMKQRKIIKKTRLKMKIINKMKEESRAIMNMKRRGQVWISIHILSLLIL